MSGESFVMRFRGGPTPGTFQTVAGWPLPDVVVLAGGKYVKVSESHLPPLDEKSHLVRGAAYEWRDKQGYEEGWLTEERL